MLLGIGDCGTNSGMSGSWDLSDALGFTSSYSYGVGYWIRCHHCCASVRNSSYPVVTELRFRNRSSPQALQIGLQHQVAHAWFAEDAIFWRACRYPEDPSNYIG